VARFPDDGGDAQSLLQHADVAMYQAKQAGGGVRFYHRRLGGRVRRRMALELRLRRAVEREELELVYQPRLSLEDLRLCGVEALLRWPAGEVGPERFVPVLEETGLIREVGRWVRDTALAQVRRWRERHRLPLRLSVNVAAPELRQGRIVNELVDQATAHGIVGPGELELELTERVLIQDDRTTRRALEGLHEAGLAIALDDFGTGYSSLAYLKRMPIDVIKLDRGFVADLPGDAGSLAIVRAVLVLAAALDKTVVAEGVENGRQLELLRRQRCTEAQGYHLAPPLSIRQMDAYLARMAP